jgi:hypothetical protein
MHKNKIAIHSTPGFVDVTFIDVPKEVITLSKFNASSLSKIFSLLRPFFRPYAAKTA